jgi:hypothetical protein
VAWWRRNDGAQWLLFKVFPPLILQHEILWNGSEEMMVLTPAEVGLMTGSGVTHHPTLGGTVLERVKGKDYKVNPQ